MKTMKTTRRSIREQSSETTVEKHYRLCLQYKKSGPQYEEAAGKHKRRFFAAFNEVIKS